MCIPQPSIKRTNAQKVHLIGALDCAQRLNPTLVERWSPKIGGSDFLAVMVETVAQ
jgi:hypothetical protein